MIDTTPFKKLYPFASNWLDLDGNRYHYLDEGPQDAPVIVMLHGNPTWSFYYRHLIPPLSQNHRVVVPDHMGCGLSDKPQNYTYTLDQHIKNVEALIDHLGVANITLMVHDWGGMIGMAYAVNHPAMIKQFIIFNTSAFYLKKIPFSILLGRTNIVGGILIRGFNAFAGSAVRMAMTNHKRMTKEVKAGYLAPYNSWPNRIAIHRFVQDIPWEDDHPSRPILMHTDAAIGQFQDRPMLIIWGADDFVFTEKEFFTEWKRRFPNAESHVLKNVGHYVIEDAPERVLPLVTDFLNKETNTVSPA